MAPAAATNECYYTVVGYPIILYWIHAELQYQIQQGIIGVQLTELQHRQCASRLQQPKIFTVWHKSQNVMHSKFS